MPEQGFHITDERLDPISDNAGLAGGQFEVGFKNGTVRTSKRLPAGTLFQLVNQNLAGPNNRPDLKKHVRYLSSSTPGFGSLGDDSALDTLDPNFLCLGCECRVESEDNRPAWSLWELRYDVNGPLRVWRDGTFRLGGKVNARWFRKDDAAALTAGTQNFNPATTRYVAGSQVVYQLRLWQTATELLRASYPDNLIPTPSEAPGNPWKEVSAAPADVKLQVVGRTLLLELLGEDQVVSTRLYRITGRADGLDVLVEGRTVNSLAYADAYTVPANADVPVEPVSYDIATDTVSPRSSGGPGLPADIEDALNAAANPSAGNPLVTESALGSLVRRVDVQADPATGAPGIGVGYRGNQIEQVQPLVLQKVLQKAAYDALAAAGQLAFGVLYRVILSDNSILCVTTVREGLPAAVGTRYVLGSGGALQAIQAVLVSYSSGAGIGWSEFTGSGGGGSSYTDAQAKDAAAAALLAGTHTGAEVDYNSATKAISINVTGGGGVPTTPLAAPTGLTLTATGVSTATASWNQVAGNSGYYLQQATNASFSENLTGRLIATDITSTDLTGLSGYTVYYVRVFAIGSGSYNHSAYTAAASARTQAGPLVSERVNDTDARNQYSAGWTYRLFDNVDNNQISRDSHVANFVPAGSQVQVSVVATLTGASDEAFRFHGQADWGSPFDVLVDGQIVYSYAGQAGAGPPGSGTLTQVLYTSAVGLSGTHTFTLRKRPTGSTQYTENENLFYDGYSLASRAGAPAPAPGPGDAAPAPNPIGPGGGGGSGVSKAYVDAADDALRARIVTLESDLLDAENEINGLENRVQELEDAPAGGGGGVPFTYLKASPGVGAAFVPHTRGATYKLPLANAISNIAPAGQDILDEANGVFDPPVAGLYQGNMNVSLAGGTLPAGTSYYIAFSEASNPDAYLDNGLCYQWFQAGADAADAAMVKDFFLNAHQKVQAVLFVPGSGSINIRAAISFRLLATT